MPFRAPHSNKRLLYSRPELRYEWGQGHSTRARRSNVSEEQKEPEPRLVDYLKGRREDVKWVWPGGRLDRLLEKPADDKSEKKDPSTD